MSKVIRPLSWRILKVLINRNLKKKRLNHNHSNLNNLPKKDWYRQYSEAEKRKNDANPFIYKEFSFKEFDYMNH